MPTKKTRPKKPPTPKTIVRNALRKLWLQSRERSAALRREGYTCERCGKKQSKAKGKEVRINAHHKNGVDWGDLVDLVFERLLQTSDDIEILCVDCHDEEHTKAKDVDGWDDEMTLKIRKGLQGTP